MKKKEKDNTIICYYCGEEVKKEDSWGVKKMRACRACAKKAQDNPLLTAKNLVFGGSKEISEEKIVSTGQEIKHSKSKMRKMKRIARMFGYSKEELEEAKREMGMNTDDDPA